MTHPPLAECHGLPALSGCIMAVDLRSGPQYVFPLEAAPPFLPDGPAVAKACEALATEDCNVDQWQVIRAGHGRRKTPDGTLDRYLVRYQDTHGRVAFTNGKQSRTCDVLLQGSRVVWTVFRGM